MYFVVIPDAVLMRNALWIKLRKSQTTRSTFFGSEDCLWRLLVVLHWCVCLQISVCLVELSRVLTELSFLGSPLGELLQALLAQSLWSTVPWPVVLLCWLLDVLGKEGELITCPCLTFCIILTALLGKRKTITSRMNMIECGVKYEGSGKYTPENLQSCAVSGRVTNALNLLFLPMLWEAGALHAHYWAGVSVCYPPELFYLVVDMLQTFG